MRIGKGTPLRLPAKSRSRAHERYKAVLQRSLSCVSEAVWYVADAQRGAKGEFVLLASVAPMAFQRESGTGVYFSATQNFHLERDHRFKGEWKVKTDRYEYTVSFSPSLEPEVLAWHWHPGTKPSPHLHAQLEGDESSLHKLHVPTGRVTFEEVIRFLIQDLGVSTCRPDWEEVLGDSEARFKKYQTWS